MAMSVLSRHYLVAGGAPPPPARMGPHPHAKTGLRPVATYEPAESLSAATGRRPGERQRAALGGGAPPATNKCRDRTPIAVGPKRNFPPGPVSKSQRVPTEHVGGGCKMAEGLSVKPFRAITWTDVDGREAGL